MYGELVKITPNNDEYFKGQEISVLNGKIVKNIKSRIGLRKGCKGMIFNPDYLIKNMPYIPTFPNCVPVLWGLKKIDLKKPIVTWYTKTAYQIHVTEEITKEPQEVSEFCDVCTMCIDKKKQYPQKIDLEKLTDKELNNLCSSELTEQITVKSHGKQHLIKVLLDWYKLLQEMDDDHRNKAKERNMMKDSK